MEAVRLHLSQNAVAGQCIAGSRVSICGLASARCAHSGHSADTLPGAAFRTRIAVGSDVPHDVGLGDQRASVACDAEHLVTAVFEDLAVAALGELRPDRLHAGILSGAPSFRGLRRTLHQARSKREEAVGHQPEHVIALAVGATRADRYRGSRADGAADLCTVGP